MHAGRRTPGVGVFEKRVVEYSLDNGVAFEPKTLEPYTAAVRRIHPQMVRIAALTASELPQRGPLDRLEARINEKLDWNARAQRSFEKAGFRVCGRSRRGGNAFVVMEYMAAWQDAREPS